MINSVLFGMEWGASSPDPTIPFSLLCYCSLLIAQCVSHRGPLATSQAHGERPASSLCSCHCSALAYPLSLAGSILPHFRDSSRAISYEQSFPTFPMKISPSLCFHISILTSITAPVTLCYNYVSTHLLSAPSDFEDRGWLLITFISQSHFVNVFGTDGKISSVFGLKSLGIRRCHIAFLII